MNTVGPESRLRDHAGLLAVLTRARDLGFLGPGAVEDHIDHALRFLPLLDRCVEGSSGRHVDLGTGAGVPGLVLALARPSTTWLLVDSMVRRTTVLVQAVAALELTSRVQVWTGRAEDLARQDEVRAGCAAVVARSFGPPAALAECAAPLLTIGGCLLVSEPPHGTGERWSVEGLADLGLAAGSREHGIMTLQKVSPTPERYPRKSGIPAKRPLF
jgi:16S rRNA (guanine527-N7)-methyltransferase